MRRFAFITAVDVVVGFRWGPSMFSTIKRFVITHVIHSPREPITMCNKYFWTAHRYEIRRPKKKKKRTTAIECNSVDAALIGHHFMWETWNLAVFVLISIRTLQCNSIRFVCFEQKSRNGIRVERSRKLYIWWWWWCWSTLSASASASFHVVADYVKAKKNKMERHTEREREGWGDWV